MEFKNVTKLTTLGALATVTLMFSQVALAEHEDFDNEPARADKFYHLTPEPGHHHHHLYHHRHHHYHHLHGTNTSIHFILNPRLDATYDVGPFPGNFIQAPFIPLKGVNGASRMRSNADLQALATTFGAKTKTQTSLGEVDTHIEMDFYGDDNFDARKNDDYEPRMTFAYFDVQGFRIGQDTTNFFDLDSIGSTVDYGTIMGGFVRQGQIRYTHFPHHHHHHWKWSAALERPATDYTNEEGVITRQYDASAVPDFTLNIKYQKHNAHATLRGLVRELRVKEAQDVNGTAGVGDHESRDTAFGLGVSGRYFFVDGSSIFGQFNFGDGIGRYIVDHHGQSAFFNDETGIFRSQRASFGTVGLEVIWPTHCHNIRSNFIYSHSQVDVSSQTPVLTGDIRVTESIDKFFTNILYEPIKHMDLGIEYNYARRESFDEREGHISRVSAAAVYHF